MPLTPRCTGTLVGGWVSCVHWRTIGGQAVSRAVQAVGFRQAPIGCVLCACCLSAGHTRAPCPDGYCHLPAGAQGPPWPALRRWWQGRFPAAPPGLPLESQRLHGGTREQASHSKAQILPGWLPLHTALQCSFRVPWPMRQAAAVNAEGRKQSTPASRSHTPVFFSIPITPCGLPGCCCCSEAAELGRSNERRPMRP